MALNKPTVNLPSRLRMVSQQQNHPHQREQDQLGVPQSGPGNKRKKGFWLKSLGSLLGRKVVELLWPSLRNFALGLLVDALGFSIGLATSLVIGCRALDKRRSFEVSTPQAICNDKRFLEDLIRFEDFSLGSFPLVVEYVKMVESHESAAVLDLKVHLATNSNARAILTLPGNVLRLPAVEKGDDCSLTLHLSQLVGRAVLRVSFAPLVPRFPCFGNVHFSILETPELDFCLSTYAGLDLMSLPGISGILHQKIQSAIAGHMLWPRRFTLRTKAAEVTTGRTRRAVGTVTVEVVEATELTQAGLLLAQNILYPSPYVKAYIDPSRSVTTATASYTCEPVWREVIRLPVMDHETDALTFEVHDASALLVDSLIGSCVLHVSNLTPGIPQHFTLGLWGHRGQPRGELELIATFRVLQSETMPRKLLSEDATLARPGMQPRLQLHADGPGLLEVAVWRGVDLDASSWLGRNPDEAQFLCKVFLAGEERVTKVAEGRGDPQWEESFEFLLDQPPVTEKLLIEVWSRSPEAMLVGSAEKMVGSVEIALCDAVKNKRIVDVFQLHHTKQGYLKLELQWRLLADAS
ncbi:unnamed protein product [Closterium sp. Yama58-4]|nr:unnamed protein product [Closterium sp. Yama58-4]